MWSLSKQVNYLRYASSGKNIILTGVPRSGTTLLCRLLCEVPEVIALNEPMDRRFFPKPAAANKAIDDHFSQFRRSLYFRGTALARGRAGKIVDNAFAEESSAVRERVITRETVHFDKTLSPGFTLLMKHCAEFTLILPELINRYPVFAVIRNPLAVLASWHSVNVPVSRGKVAKSARLNPDFHARLNELPEDLLTRQLFILSWYFEQYQALKKQQIIRYEEIAADSTAVLDRITGKRRSTTTNNLENRNINQLYRDTNLSQLVDGLLASEGAYWDFYEQEEVLELAKKMKASYGK